MYNARVYAAVVPLAHQNGTMSHKKLLSAVHILREMHIAWHSHSQLLNQLVLCNEYVTPI